MTDFSPFTRAQALERFERDRFDLLVIGGGITGAAVAREAVARGLSVALIEKRDFSYGTSSRSSKLIHGGLRYLEKFEFKLVFEALAERALLLRTAPTMVRPLPFYFPVYQGSRPSRAMLGMGMWLYDLLSLFRSPGRHESLSREKFLEAVPFAKAEGLEGGFRYFDASMWDDVLGVEVLRDSARHGAAVANYVEALMPIWEGERIAGFGYRDSLSGREGRISATQVISCVGPWTDLMGVASQPFGKKSWKDWLAPSKGVHLVFDLKKLPVPGAVVMSEPKDGRISFAIPRPDYGAGVVLVGTTDGPTPRDPDQAVVEREDIEYLLGLLRRYFPGVSLSASDILSTTVGVRPLVSPAAGSGAGANSESLQKVSREHHIAHGPGGMVFVAGGKYTTHRTMGEEIVRFAVKGNLKLASAFSRARAGFSTHAPINAEATAESLARAKQDSRASRIPESLWERYGAEALKVLEIHESQPTSTSADPEGFPFLEAQLRFSIRQGMVVHLEDFYFRRVPLFLARADHGLPWVETLSRAWMQELELSEEHRVAEVQALEREVAAREAWRKGLS